MDILRDIWIHLLLSGTMIKFLPLDFLGVKLYGIP